MNIFSAVFRRGRRELAIFAVLAALGSLLAGCLPERRQAEGVELVRSPEAAAPDMTFELRFESALVQPGATGLVESNSPLVITPPVAGKFTWLSSRSGIFTPAEPFALATRYVLSLRRGLRDANGGPVKAKLSWTVATPPFGLAAAWPRAAGTNAASDPEIKLAFNADVLPRDARKYLYFRDANGRRVPAEVRQGTLAEISSFYSSGEPGPIRPWPGSFAGPGAPAAGRSESGDTDGTNELANLIVATPREALPVGKGWKLVVSPGIRSRAGSLRLREPAGVPVGDVTPFVLGGVLATNYLNAGPSIQFLFSKPLPETLTNNFSDWLSIWPRPTNLAATVERQYLTLRGGFKGGSRYVVGLRAGFPSIEPFALALSNQATLWMPPVAPRLYFPALSEDQLAGGRRVFPMMSINVSKARVRAKIMDWQTAIHALRGYASYFRDWKERRDADDWAEPYQRLNYNLLPGRTVFDEELDLEPRIDVSKQVNLEWDRVLGGRKAAVVFLDAERVDGRPALGTQALIQLTDLGLVWKRGKDGVDVHVFSHASGRAVSGAVARLFSDENEPLAEAVTDGSGMARLRAGTNAVWIAAHLGDDFHALPLRDAWASYAYGYSHGFEPQENESDSDEPSDRRRVLLFSDRKLYRPGEDLHLEALVRDWGERGLSTPSGLTGSLKCLDARDRLFFQTNATFSTDGSWSVSVPLPRASRGSYTARLRLGTNDYSHTFLVQDFQPDAFELSLPTRPEYSAGEKIELPLSARYLFGKPLSRARVKWSMEAADSDFHPKGFEEFTFRGTELDYRNWRRRSSATLGGAGSLGGATNFVIAPEIPLNPVSPQPRAVSLLVEVTDVNQQTISRRIEFLRHSSDFYLGIRQAATVSTAGAPPKLEVAVARADGQPWTEPVNAQLVLRSVQWQTVRLQGAGKTVRYRSEVELSNVFEKTIEISPVEAPVKPGDAVSGRPIEGLPGLPAGEYLVELAARDSAGRAVMSSRRFGVSAPGTLSWNYRNDVQLALKPDRERYAPGDTAVILVEAPFSGDALVTVEREKVLRSFIARLDGNAPSISVPLGPGDAPNVYVSVTLLRGADNCPRSVKEPEYRAGYCELPVIDPASRLAVTVAPGAPSYQPGQPVPVAVRVADSRGKAAAGAGVVLYAVDEGVLNLSSYDLPDPLGFFYAPRPLAVQTGVSLPKLLTEDPEELRFQNKGYLGGGGGMNRARKNFLACAFWSASLTTDSGGKAEARFPAPDSLTRYRVFAVAYRAEKFGGAQSTFQVSKPLILEPALPSFANITDRLAARGVVQNQTGHSGDVLVSLKLDDKAKPARPDEPLEKRVSIAGNGSAVVEFPVVFAEAGDSKWLWEARFVDPAMGDFTDSVQSRVEVGHVSPVLREVVYSRWTNSAGNLLASANPQLLAGQGTITVNLSNSRLSELAEAAAQLLEYPYGCVEQASSTMLPWILLRDTTSLAPFLGRDPKEVATAISSGMARLFSMQTRSGGLGYWPRDKEPMLWGSAYGGMVLALARRHGVEVPKEDFDALLKYLHEQLRTDLENPSEVSGSCLALYTLALVGQAEPAYHEKLFSGRETLAPENKALLALAIGESDGPAAMIRELLKPGPAARRIELDPFGSGAREMAIRLLAWTRFQPRDPVVEKLAGELMGEQKESHWGTTQGDAWSILALTEHARRVEAVRSAAGSLSWGDQTIRFNLDARTNLFTKSFSLTNRVNGSLPLANVSGSLVYASVAVEARPPETPQPAQDRGFGLQRRYDRLDDDNHPQDLRGLRVGDRVLVTLRLVVRAPARYVAIDDALPSVLEAVNPAFDSREARGTGQFANDAPGWYGDFQETRKDRCLSFGNWVGPGEYVWRYVARAKASGTVTAPSAKVQEMYHPGRYGLSGTRTISCEDSP